MSVGDICGRDVVTINADASLVAAAQLMREKHVGMLVVVESIPGSADQVVQGVLTDRDIVVTVIGRDAEPKSLKVNDVMTRYPLLASEGQPVEAVLRRMSSDGIRRVPVVGLRNQLVGVLSIDDVWEVMSGQLGAIAGALRAGRSLERTRRP